MHSGVARFDAHPCCCCCCCCQVKHLSLHFNALTSLPAGIAGCEGLVWLSLNANRLTGLPEEICSMTALVRLSLHINQVGAVSL
jgi:Leucine-rich repeat (LRR) protein